ncbi:hypothetical protein EDB85DRAFT_1899920 [Lactarius pseudohatsudake]|nr:hypothetical protein EDB85DRAFT_1899920 [Lactarius pseudohatsudake]
MDRSPDALFSWYSLGLLLVPILSPVHGVLLWLASPTKGLQACWPMPQRGCWLSACSHVASHVSVRVKPRHSQYRDPFAVASALRHHTHFQILVSSCLTTLTPAESLSAIGLKGPSLPTVHMREKGVRAAKTARERGARKVWVAGQQNDDNNSGEDGKEKGGDGNDCIMAPICLMHVHPFSTLPIKQQNWQKLAWEYQEKYHEEARLHLDNKIGLLERDILHLHNNFNLCGALGKISSLFKTPTI